MSDRPGSGTSRLKPVGVVLAALLCIATTACAGQGKEGSRMSTTWTADDALKAGIAEIAKRYPDFDPARKTAVVTDKGDSWEVTYRLPIDMLGGAPVLILRKSDLAVEKAFRSQ